MPAARILAAACALLAAAVCAAGAAAQDDPYAPLLAPAGTCAQDDAVGLPLDQARQTMLCLTNYARAESGLAPLRLDPALDDAGQAKLGADLSCGEFSHTPCGKPFDSVFGAYLGGAQAYQVGENIAWGNGGYASPRSTMDGWIHSAGHRENLLTAAYRDLGIGYVPGTSFLGHDGVSLWSQEFGVRSAPVQAKPKPRPRRYRRR